MNDLKPCPFCGGDAEIYKLKFDWKNICYRIHCKEFCCIQVQFYKTKEDAVMAWNGRNGSMIEKI